MENIVDTVSETVAELEVPTISIVAAGVVVAGVAGAGLYGIYKASTWAGRKIGKAIKARHEAKVAAVAAVKKALDEGVVAQPQEGSATAE